LNDSIYIFSNLKKPYFTLFWLRRCENLKLYPVEGWTLFSTLKCLCPWGVGIVSGGNTSFLEGLEAVFAVIPVECTTLFFKGILKIFQLQLFNFIHFFSLVFFCSVFRSNLIRCYFLYLIQLLFLLLLLFIFFILLFFRPKKKYVGFRFPDPT
jgi:hypothetical protein